MLLYQFSSLSELVAYYQQDGRIHALCGLLLWLFAGLLGYLKGLMALCGLLPRLFVGHCFCRFVILASGCPDLGRGFLAAACSRQAEGDGLIERIGDGGREDEAGRAERY